jgi:hypothetical protein
LTRIAAIAAEIEKLNAEITRIEGPEKERRAAAQQERLETYIAFFKNLKLEQETLEALYVPVRARPRYRL